MGVVKFSYYTFFIAYCNFFGSKGREKKAERNFYLTTFFIWCIKDTVIKQNANVNKDYDMFNIFVGFIQHASIDTAHDLLSKLILCF